MTNAATVSGGGDVNPTNNSDTDVTTIVPGADLTITKSHTGNFTQGQTGATYTVTVTNSGVGPTTAPVTVTDTFPLGLTPTAAVGEGWSCTVGAQAVGCSRSDALAAGASYPPITITLNVASNAPATVTNVAGVSGGGDSNSANNTASDATTIMAGADLTVTKTHTGNFTQGQRGAAYTITVGNSGGGPDQRPGHRDRSRSHRPDSVCRERYGLDVRYHRAGGHLCEERPSEPWRQLPADHCDGGCGPQCPGLAHQLGQGYWRRGHQSGQQHKSTTSLPSPLVPT